MNAKYTKEQLLKIRKVLERVIYLQGIFPKFTLFLQNCLITHEKIKLTVTLTYGP